MHVQLKSGRTALIVTQALQDAAAECVPVLSIPEMETHLRSPIIEGTWLGMCHGNLSIQAEQPRPGQGLELEIHTSHGGLSIPTRAPLLPLLLASVLCRAHAVTNCPVVAFSKHSFLFFFLFAHLSPVLCPIWERSRLGLADLTLGCMFGWSACSSGPL